MWTFHLPSRRHALWATAASLLAASGTHPKVAQSILRHSDINLTMSRYTHVFRGQETDAVAALPDLDAAPAKQSAKATRTGNATAQAARAAQDATASPRAGDHGPVRPMDCPRGGDARKAGEKNSAFYLARKGAFSRISPRAAASKAQTGDEKKSVAVCGKAAIIMAETRCGRGGRVAEGDGLLNRCTGSHLYPGFESRPLR